MTKHTDTPATPWKSSEHTLAENVAEAQRLAAWLNDHISPYDMDASLQSSALVILLRHIAEKVSDDQAQG